MRDLKISFMVFTQISWFAPHLVVIPCSPINKL